VLLEYLDLEEKDKSALTRAVKAVFPGAELRRIRKKDCPEMYLFYEIMKFIQIPCVKINALNC
jgi:hypothetical protein